VDNAECAIKWFEDVCEKYGVVPTSLGIDTLTVLAMGRSANRPADLILRSMYPVVVKSVCSPNSLYGSMGLNGVSVAIALLEKWPDLAITETHPKVLYHCLTKKLELHDWDNNAGIMKQRLQEWMGVGAFDMQDDNAWDAAISAYAARQWSEGKWTRNLHNENVRGMRIVHHIGCGQACFAWPE